MKKLLHKLLNSHSNAKLSSNENNNIEKKSVVKRSPPTPKYFTWSVAFPNSQTVCLEDLLQLQNKFAERQHIVVEYLNKENKIRMIDDDSLPAQENNNSLSPSPKSY